MLRIIKLVFWALVVMLALWELPWCYNFFFTGKGASVPFTLYSSVVGEFAMLDYNDKKFSYSDRTGREYTEEQFDSILPMFYYHQLVTDGRFPETICGVSVTPRQIQISNFNYRLEPSELNKPHTGLYQMLETMSGRVDLVLPDDVFRLTDTGIEFIDMATNSVNEQKSKTFTDMMISKGFRFPAYRIAGNPTDRKEYDEGYVILDADRKLFHIKMTKGRPYCRAIELPEGMRAEYLYITEFTARTMLAFIIDTDGGFWVVNRPSYDVVKSGLPPIDPNEESVLIMGNMFDWTVTVRDDVSRRYYALSASDYSLLDSMTYDTPSNAIKGLEFTSHKDKFVRFRWE